MTEINSKIVKAQNLILKRNVFEILELLQCVDSTLVLQMIPYASLICCESITYLKSMGMPIALEETGKYSIHKMRQKTKFFDESVDKIINISRNIDEIQDAYFSSLIKLRFIKEKNIYNNLGITFDSQKHILSNTYYSCYIFQDDNKIRKKISSVNYLTLEKDDLQQIGYDISSNISIVANLLRNDDNQIVFEMMKYTEKLKYSDYNTNRLFHSKELTDKYLSLFLLDILSNVGFVMFYLKKIVIIDAGLLMRIEYILYYYTLSRVKSIKEYCNNSIDNNVSSEITNLVQCCDSDSTNDLLNSDFRSCMMHFGLVNPKNKILIDINEIDYSKKLCGLVEMHFKMTENEFQNLLEKRLNLIFDILNDFFNSYFYKQGKYF